MVKFLKEKLLYSIEVIALREKHYFGGIVFHKHKSLVQNRQKKSSQTYKKTPYPFHYCLNIFEPCHKETGFLHMRKQRCRSAVR